MSPKRFIMVNQYIIVQAGGKGTRLEHHTWNKPKCLLAVDGKPILYHLFNLFPEAHFIVIGDYLFDRLEEYIKFNPPNNVVELIKAHGKGTVSGINQALSLLPDDHTPFSLIWSDLLFLEKPEIDVSPTENCIGLSNSFPCRWTYCKETELLIETTANANGVAGFFKFSNRNQLNKLPNSGEFVRWLSKSNVKLTPQNLNNIKEIGTIDALLTHQKTSSNARFFNEITIESNSLTKKSQIPEYDHLIKKELEWYKKARELGLRNIPDLIKKKPMTLSYIHGTHPFEIQHDYNRQKSILKNIFTVFEGMHSLKKTNRNKAETHAVYYVKTLERIEKIKNLIPQKNNEIITINGMKCRNILHQKYLPCFLEAIDKISSHKFCFIHGDPTFSNMLIDTNNRPFLFDPRGYFGNTSFYGDPLYDWAKLYYSVIGNYDSFNQRDFMLTVYENDVEIIIKSSSWLRHRQTFKHYFSNNDMESLELIHALLWLSLSGYVDDDYDSMLGAFYKGIYLLEQSDLF